MKFKDREPHIAVGEVLLIRGDEKNRGQWSIGVVERLIKGKDDVIRGARLKTNKSHVERAVQLLYPLELSCDIEEAVQEGGLETLNSKAPEFRPRRRAAEIARETVIETFSYERTRR